MSFEGIAYAQMAGKNAGAGQQVIFTTVIPLVFLFGIFYFLLIRPQAKKPPICKKCWRRSSATTRSSPPAD